MIVIPEGYTKAPTCETLLNKLRKSPRKVHVMFRNGTVDDEFAYPARDFRWGKETRWFRDGEPYDIVAYKFAE